MNLHSNLTTAKKVAYPEEDSYNFHSKPTPAKKEIPKASLTPKPLRRSGNPKTQTPLRSGKKNLTIVDDAIRNLEDALDRKPSCQMLTPYNPAKPKEIGFESKAKIPAPCLTPRNNESKGFVTNKNNSCKNVLRAQRVSLTNTPAKAQNTSQKIPNTPGCNLPSNK